MTWSSNRSRRSPNDDEAQITTRSGLAHQPSATGGYVSGVWRRDRLDPWAQSGAQPVRISDTWCCKHPGELAKFCQFPYFGRMSTMNISLPEPLRQFVDQQVAGRGYGTSSEYVRELIRKDQDRQHLRGLLLAGAASEPTAPLDATYFDDLRRRARDRMA